MHGLEASTLLEQKSMVRHLGIEEQDYEQHYQVVGQNSTGSAFGYVPQVYRSYHNRGIKATTIETAAFLCRITFVIQSLLASVARSLLLNFSQWKTCTTLIWKSQAATSVQASGNT